jgi:ATP-dependent DNA helicase PIF1
MAPTGIAAVNIGGVTIHSALRLKQSAGSTQIQSLILIKEEDRNRLKQIRVIIIDEISMVNAELLNFISSVFARLHRSTLPFGGVHVICFGDLMQLPPVSGQKVFRSLVWRYFNPIFLRRSERQSGDAAFISILDAVRMGDFTPEVLGTLQDRMAEYPRAEVTAASTFLVGLRQAATMLNEEMIVNLCPHSNSFTFVSTDKEEDVIQSGQICERAFKRHTNLPATLLLAVGAKVMFLNNTLLNLGISNGTCGIVQDIATLEGAVTIWPDVIVAMMTSQGLQVRAVAKPLGERY